MNRLLVSVVPVVSLAQSDEGVMLLQKHAAKQGPPGMLDEIPADRIPALAGYAQSPSTSFQGSGPCNLGQDVVSAVSDCAANCDSEPTCGGFAMPDMMLKAPVGVPVQYACYYGCTDANPAPGPGTYAYYKEDRTTTTTTSSTLYITTTTEPESYDCSPPWYEAKAHWCCDRGLGGLPGCDKPTTTSYTTTPEPESYDCSPPWFEAKAHWCCDRGLGGLPGCDKPQEPSAVDDPHITSISGHKFDVYKPGDHEFLVLPEGASPENADLHISGTVKKIGERENDLWIRKLKVQGKWVQDGPFEFKTSAVPFGNKKSALIRFGASKTWKAMDNANLDSNLHVVSAVDKKAPQVDFAQSVSKKLELKAGPVKVLIDFATSQKNGEDINHLDLHLDGLQSTHMKSMGGLLAGNVAALQVKN